MRAKTKKKHKMGRRFAILIGVAAVGVMALGAQTGAAASEGVVGYKTRVTIDQFNGYVYDGGVSSGGGKKCTVGRRVTLLTKFTKRPGHHRKLGDVRSSRDGGWGIKYGQAMGLYAKVTPKVGDGFVCSGDRSPIYKM